MYNSVTDLLFPARSIPALRDLRGDAWARLIDQVLRADPADPQRIALVLLMVRLAGCTGCQPDSYRAMDGCARCGREVIKEFRGSDRELLNLYNTAKQDVFDFLG
ncbi:MAG TPA: hypothetical protein VE136_08040 [Anaerolineales bacterium]|nr:hypothetical protein [Anaerolineales bacterium]